MSVSRELEFKVKARAKQRCEYCLMHQALQGASFHIEHIVPRSLGGRVVDEETGKTIPLFNPRTDDWEKHFRFDEYVVVGLSSAGRATLRALNFNNPRRLQIRRAEALFDLFPPARR